MGLVQPLIIWGSQKLVIKLFENNQGKGRGIHPKLYHQFKEELWGGGLAH